MFRVRNSEVETNYSVAKRLVELALVVAFSTSLVLAYSILQENRSHIVAPVGDQSQIALRLQDSLEFVLSLIVSGSVTLCIVSLVWQQKRYLHSQKCLRQVKLLAYDILASMDRGVVTANREGLLTSINSAGIELLDTTVDCVGQPLAAISSVPLVEIYLDVVVRTATVRDREFAVERNGRTLRLRVDGHVLKDDQDCALGCVIHLRDVTESVLLDDRMRRLEQSISLGTLASGLHHEIK
ncbi:MAG: PAS domain-containing sensor histidine kinase, partial [Gemmataceae bacterium]